MYAAADLALASLAFSSDGRTIATAAGDGPALATGLVSLELQLPQHDDDFYQVYRFTTPGGEAQITAWAVSESLLTRLLRLAALVAAVAVLAYLVRLASAGRLAVLWGAGGSTLMICVGLLALIFGILPVAGLIALVAGIAIKVRRAMARSAAAQSAATQPAAAAEPITAEAVEG